MNLVQRKFAHLHQQQLLGVGLDDLSAQLAADAAPRPGHQHGFVMGVQVQQQPVGLDGLAAQQVVNVQLTHIAQAHFAGDQVAQARQGAHGHLVGLQAVQNVVAPLARHAGHGQQHVGDGRGGQELGQISRVVDGQAVEHVAVQAVVVVKEAHHAHFGAVGHGRGQLPPGVARAVNQGLGQSRLA